ncbi:unnamed protein product [Leuciscus chuanchicus]
MYTRNALCCQSLGLSIIAPVTSERPSVIVSSSVCVKGAEVSATVSGVSKLVFSPFLTHSLTPHRLHSTSQGFSSTTTVALTRCVLDFGFTRPPSDSDPSTMSNSYSVSLIGPSPWGFRLQGGKDFSMSLTISKLTDGGKAAKAKISVGDVVLSIDGIATEGMTHLEAQNKIKACTGNLNLSLLRSSSVTKREIPKEEPLEIIKPVPITQTPAPATSLAPGSSAYNKTARPFGGAASTVRSISPSPTPVAPKASIPSASSAFTPAAPSQQPPPPQPPFPLGGSAPKPALFANSSSTSSSGSAHRSPSSTPKPVSGRSPFANSSSTSSSGSSSPARVTAPLAPPPPAPAAPAAPHPSVYNTPINLYSNVNACEVAMGQRRGLMESKGTGEHHNGTARKPVSEPELNHVSLPSDSSKKRLMEDTEDWHPRTGTSQSRSFRILAQITGTENDQAQENRPGKKVNKVDPELLRPQYNKLRDWHHGVSARALNIQNIAEGLGTGVEIHAPSPLTGSGRCEVVFGSESLIQVSV